MTRPLPRLIRRGQSRMSSTMCTRLCAAGDIVRVLPGTFLRTDVANDPGWRAAAVAAWRADAVLCRDAAAAQTFWPERRVSTIDIACETTLRRPGYRFQRRTIPPELIVNRGESRMTGPALTALDLAVETNGDSIDNVLRSKMVRIGDLEAALAATPYRRGNPERRRLLLNSRAEPWSAAERLAHKTLYGAGITGWTANLPLSLDGENYFLDIAFAGLKLVVEIDGYEFHSGAMCSSRTARARTHLRSLTGSCSGTPTAGCSTIPDTWSARCAPASCSPTGGRGWKV